jgi:chorismate mutase
MNNTTSAKRNDRYGNDIRRTDRKFVDLVLGRFSYALELGKIKNALGEGIRDSKREKRVIAHVCALRARLLTARLRRIVYQKIMAVTRRLEHQAPVALDFRGNRTRQSLQRAKRDVRSRIDQVDSTIVGILDRRIKLGLDAGVLKKSRALYRCDATHLECLRQEIENSSITSDQKQWIWEIFCRLLGHQACFVTVPILTDIRPTVKNKMPPKADRAHSQQAGPSTL